ncbi:hypothetical protein N7481_002178 [Penicillium waksmanii]|uniref:uncharacterized protein n=1 Tax=Penicillium waksmanii TaxID=69791 RepID=UPI002546DF11|nr:uncharacterized protein N7481_002178 [Penicillium waksmanii]KAJ5995201.1 hypothetical protein N7481_002178 [Penicillium waksmanii]
MVVYPQEDPWSSTTVRIPALQTDPPCDPSHRADPSSVPLPPSPPASPSATMPSDVPLIEPVEQSVGPGELGGSARSSPKFMAKSPGEDSPHPNIPAIPTATRDEGPHVSFEDFSMRFRQSQRKQIQRKRLEKRLRATKVSIGVSARIIRIGNTVQRGLVEALKHDDKASFAALYHTLYDLQESCTSSARRDDRDESLDEQEQSSEPELDRSSDLFNQLSPQSRADLLEILRLVRSDPQFLVDRLRSFTSSQLASFTNAATALDAGDPAFPSSSSSSSRSFRGQYAFNRNPTQSASFKDHAYAFERTNPLSILLSNVYAAPLESGTPDFTLRLDMWSSVCAQLMSQGSSKFYPLIGQILSAWATGSNWKARPKFELYLMDILQTGAFLLEHIDTPAGLDFAAEALDPLRTDVAEEFFASAVDDLFRVLDDPDGGFPSTVLQFTKAVLCKLDNLDSRSRFLEYLFVQWFFPKFLYSALTYPEAHGLLLDFHIRKDAREKLLGQVGLRAYSQVFAVLRSMNHFSILRPSIKRRVDSMISRLQPPSSTELPAMDFLTPSLGNNSSTFLLLSASDILTLLDALFPRSSSTLHSPQDSAGFSSWASSLSPTYNIRPDSYYEPGFFRSPHDADKRPISRGSSVFSMETSSMSAPESRIGQTAARIRFELSDSDESTERPRLEAPSDEHWTIFSVAQDGRGLTWSLLPDCGSRRTSVIESDDDAQSTSLGLEENYEALQTAIIRLVQEDQVYDSDDISRDSSSFQTLSKSLKQRFNQAMASSHHCSNFVGAHYWWNASRQLRQGNTVDSSPMGDDSWILGPMHSSCSRSLTRSRAVIDRCEGDFVSLGKNLRCLQTHVKSLMTTISKLRNKMWYMTDVKNSMRYEEARHVAMALKTMIYSSRPYFDMPEEPRSRTGARSLGGSLFQKPEVQVMNMMKAPSSQGGPKKLSDEQVELTRKWLAHNAIDNFCKGEERIHRFCYEVRTSISRLVGETMAETPVLWASELFQRERVRYEGYGNHSFPGLSVPTTPRPSTTASEDPMHTSQLYGSNIHMPEFTPRFSHETPFMGRRPSVQSIGSDKTRPARDLPSIDISSIAGSPGRAASTSTGDTCSTFWSAPQRHPMYANSVSSVYSRPPSMFSETATRQTRRSERKTVGKSAFMDDLRQTLTSLLLSDLGSPVWSCGSETDAWFTNKLDETRVRVQMQRHAAVEKFWADYEERSKGAKQHRQTKGGRRSISLEPPVSRRKSSPSDESPSSRDQESNQDDESAFSYKAVFHRLIEVFSRHGNPFVKLNALRDLRSLVVASLISSHDANLAGTSSNIYSSGADRLQGPRQPRPRATRHSFSEMRPAGLASMDPEAPITSVDSVTCESRPSDYCPPSEDEIVATLRDLILEVKPKTLFRDLQFISAFVPSDHLSKTDRGTAFLQFGLAALSLKDEVCNAMVEIADRIVSQELMCRHPLPGSDFYPRPSHAIEDAAAMWIVTAKEGNPVAQRELAILYLTHPERLPRVTLPLTCPRDTFKAEMMYMRGKDSKSDPQSMCLALHWMQLSASGGDLLARNRLREREEFDSIA